MYKMKNSGFKIRASFLAIGIWLGILLLSVPAFGEFYKYVGPDGRIRFTDDYSKVPNHKHPRLKEYAEYKNQNPVSDAVDKISTGQEPKNGIQNNISPKDIEDIPSETTSTKHTLDEIRKRHDAKKQELDLEYQTLMKERELLENEQKSLTTEDVKQLNQKIISLNEKIEDHEKRRNDLNTEIERYNVKVMEKNNASNETAQNTTP